MAISKGKRSYRNGPLLTACEKRGLWTAAVDLLKRMPQDLNGAPQRGLKLLLTTTGREGF
jgi:hypothetical protein